MNQTISASSLFLRLGFRGRSASHSPPLALFKLKLKPKLCHGRLCSSSALAPAPAAEHPWPEWLSFLHSLNAKGYLKSPNAPDHLDYHLLKEACLSFARDRYDVFRSLSVQEIQTLVEAGCPTLIRKSVNSSKRLRIYARLDEADVCGACDSRGSCDRAYLLLNESESAARTVDIMRLLLSYALDPLIASGEDNPRRQLVSSSARKLLSELMQLTETPLDPSLPKPASHPPSQNKKPACIGQDWTCPGCNFLNFGRNTNCMKCKADRPETLGSKADGARKLVGVKNFELKKGDWNCLQCNFMNFARNVQCRNCKAEGPERVGMFDVEMKKGDWDCPQCHFLNFARNKNCFRCQESRPQRELNPGEWECPSCDYLNYRRNTVCLKCKHDSPLNNEDQIWRKPN